MDQRKWGWHWPAASLTVLVGMISAGCTPGLSNQMNGSGMYPPQSMGMQGYPGMQQGMQQGMPQGMPQGMQQGMHPGGNPMMHQAMRPPQGGQGGLQQAVYQPGVSSLPQPTTSDPYGGVRGLPLNGAPPTTMLAPGPTMGPLPMQGPVIQGGPGYGVPMQGMPMHGAPLQAMPAGQGMQGMPAMEGPPPLPRELTKSVMPPYTLEPPDTIFIEVVRAIPKPPYRIEPLDQLVINVGETLPNQPIAGNFLVSPDGLINLGFAYGVVRVAGLTLEQAASAIRLVLRSKLNDPQVGVGLAAFRGTAALRGEFMLAMDGTITLGTYGCVQLAGLTLAQAKAMIEKHLSQWLMNPEVSVTVTGYNSKVYYIITDGGGFGQAVYRLPITGNETVLDALAQVQGLPTISSKRRIWLARPAPACKGCYQILPIHWEVITQAGDTETNWQLFPGDRIFVGADPWIEWDNRIAKVMAPIERMLGITLLGVSTVQAFRNVGFNNGNFNNGGVIVPVGR